VVDAVIIVVVVLSFTSVIIAVERVGIPTALLV
jgi:hypothetical protein